MKFGLMKKTITAVALTAMMAASFTVNAEGTYLSELTGQPISTAIQTQRPVAIMVDNEKTALKHYGTAEADIVYEMMNNTKNGRITRLMCIYKDWQKISQAGSIRSVRTTNFPMAGEYNAVVVHDGGPYYINEWIAKPWVDHLSGGFGRVNNGKAREFTEYVLTGQLASRMKAAKISTTYNQYAPERASHFVFNAGDTKLSAVYKGITAASSVDLTAAFPHNQSQLKYNASTGTYDYYVYGGIHTDAEDGQVLSFKNVILQDTSFGPCNTFNIDGYINYNVTNATTPNRPAYYLTNGEVMPVTWTKVGETGITKYFDASGAEIKMNPGKTYITLVPEEYWSGVVIK